MLAARTEELPEHRELVKRKMVLPRHRGDLFAYVLAVHDEERIDEVRCRKRGLTDERTQTLALTKAAETGEGTGRPNVNRHRLAAPLLAKVVLQIAN
jgi:hypothetical protein